MRIIAFVTEGSTKRDILIHCGELDVMRGYVERANAGEGEQGAFTEIGRGGAAIDALEPMAGRSFLVTGPHCQPRERQERFESASSMRFA